MAKKEMEETTTTTTTMNEDGSKTTTTKVIKKSVPTRTANERDDAPAPPRQDGDGPVDGGTHAGGPPGRAVCCVPLLCTIL